MNIKLIIVSMLSSITMLSCSQGKSRIVEKPEDIGKQVFQILKNLPSTSEKDYLKNFITLKEMRQMANNKELIQDENVRQEMLREMEDIEDFRESQRRTYKNLKEFPTDYWSTLEYVSFEYTIETQYGVKQCYGTLYCNVKAVSEDIGIYDSNIVISIKSVFNGKGYILCYIGDDENKYIEDENKYIEIE